MPANKTYRQDAGKQRYHRHRLGRMLVPHGCVSGLLFTVNPRQESKALRELQLYLHPLIADLEAAHKRAEDRAEGRGGCETGTTEGQRPPQMCTDAGDTIAPSTSSLLAAELAEYVSAGAGQRHGGMRRGPSGEENSDATDDDDDDEGNTANNNNNNNDGNDYSDDDGHSADKERQSPARKRRRHDTERAQRTVTNCRRWLAPLETGCKGHLMISIPFAPQERRDDEERETGKATAEAQVGRSEATEVSAPHPASLEDAAAPRGQDTSPHSILCNPLVPTVVERIFHDLEENPRPLLRNCFRLMPCELTCCPTLPEMREALGRLVGAHFPPPEGPQRLHRVSLSFKVKNNTGVENKKSYFHATLETVFPPNRFVVIPAARLKSCDGEVEAVFCVLVAHATCAMGVQPRFSERGEYNLHALGAKHLELASVV